MQPDKPFVVALMGPTASGKTELAIDIAKKFIASPNSLIAALKSASKIAQARRK